MKRTKKAEEIISKMEDVKLFIEDQKASIDNQIDGKSDRWLDGDRGQEALENQSKLEDLENEATSLFDNLTDLFEE